MKILVVDDEENIRNLIEKFAVYDGYDVVKASNGLEAVNIATENNDIDLIIMDVMMPELNGFSACKEIRKTKSTPIIMLSARGEEYDRIHGFEMGIDDYVIKPFSPKELMMRVNAVLKRAARESGGEKSHDLFTYGDLKIDFTARKVYINDKNIELSPKEYDLLFCFVKNKNVALSRERLLSEIWGNDFDGDERTLDTHIKVLRKSIGEYARLIVTVRGVGYRFEI